MSEAAGFKRGPFVLSGLIASALFLACFAAALAQQGRSEAPDTSTELLVTNGAPGRYGGQLVVSERSQLKTLNPVTAVDNVSRDAIQLMSADLIHINRESQRTEPAL